MEQLEDNCLEDKEVAARISVYRQFYQLAKDSHDNFRKSVFDVLCAHLRNMTSAISYKEGVGKLPYGHLGFCAIYGNMRVMANHKAKTLSTIRGSAGKRLTHKELIQ